LTGSITDPAGDAVPRPGVSAVPDLVGATIGVGGGTLTITVSFVPGTLSQTQTFFQVQLDTDENPGTGFSGVDSSHSDANAIGADYTIEAVSPRNSTQALIRRAIGPDQLTTVGTTSVSFPTVDQARIVVPLTMLGNDDGRLKFKVVCSQWLSDTTGTGITDYMPDVGLAPGVVR
jgi:hypothetical protein